MRDNDPRPLLLQRVELNGHPDTQVLLEHGRVAAIGGPELSAPGVDVLDGEGGALIRGLNDHHLHLFAMAAADRSVLCGPPAVTDLAGLATALRAAAAAVSPGEWVRGVGYDEHVVGELTTADLDRLLGDLADRPTRIGHRSGHAWLLNTEARRRLGLDPVGGLLLDAGDLLRERLTGGFPDLTGVSERLAGYGVTAVTDAGAHNGPVELAGLQSASGHGELLQRCLVLGGPDLPAGLRADLPVGGEDLISTGARKIVLAEHNLPGLDELVEQITAAGPRGVALHAASLETVVLAVAALAAAGQAGQRVEHASVAPPPLVAQLARLQARVVTQPGFVHRHGDRYLRTVDAADQPWLYRLRGWLDAGVRLGAGSDAPYGPEDPWTAIRAAVQRRTSTGQPLGMAESLNPEAALALFTSSLRTPGTPPGPLAVGDPADLCLLAVPWRQAREELTAELVRATVVNGQPVKHA